MGFPSPNGSGQVHFRDQGNVGIRKEEASVSEPRPLRNEWSRRWDSLRCPEPLGEGNPIAGSIRFLEALVQIPRPLSIGSLFSPGRGSELVLSR